MMSSLKHYLSASAKYNKHANQLVFQSVQALQDEQYYQPLVRNCRSVHALLNHILAVDLAWISEVLQQPSIIQSGEQIVCENRSDIIRIRGEVDDEILQVVEELGEEALGALVEYPDAAAGVLRWPLMLELAHILRHSTHHRGQLALLVEAAGLEALKIDDLFVPSDIEYQAASRLQL